MKQKEFVYTKNGQDYKVFVTYKHQRNTYFRFKDGCFHVTTPYLTSKALIFMGIDKYFDRFIKQKVIKHFSLDEDYAFVLGNKVSLSELNIKNNEELQDYLYKKAVSVLTEEVRKYEELMGIESPYKIRVKNTARQFGSNSKKTHTLSFQLSLIHYSLDIIDTVVVHELAHEFERNHQKSFYDVVYKYSPNYRILQKKLKKGIHQ